MQNSTPFFLRLFLSFSCLFGLLTFCSAQKMPVFPSNELKLPNNSYTSAFKWQGDSVSGAWESHRALLIPVQLPNCKKVFYLQFDTGSPYSLFYSAKLKAIASKYPNAVQNINSDYLADFTFKVGKENISAKKIAIKQFGSPEINWKKNSIEIIGTIGVDFFDQKTLMIDFPNKKITIAPAAPTNVSLELTDFMYIAKRILLPTTIQNVKKFLFYDSGSSAFPLLTDQKTVAALRVPNTTVTQFEVKSWDQSWTANTFPSKDSLTIGGQKLPIPFVTYMEGPSASEIAQMMKMGIGGMTGNQLFLGSTLIIDTKNKKFGIVKSGK